MNTGNKQMPGRLFIGMNEPYEPTLSQRNTGMDYQKFSFPVKALPALNAVTPV
jgi:hypothetical protein